MLRRRRSLGRSAAPAHGVVWSLSLNVLAYVVFSLGEPASIDGAG
jgi:hypothetical protein